MNYEIVHELPGRLRVRLLVPGCRAMDREQTEAYFRGVAGVEKVSFNPRTRNILIRYESGANVRRAVLEKVETTPCTASFSPSREITELERKRRKLMTSGSLLLLRPIIPPPLNLALGLYGSWPVFKKGAASLWGRNLNSDVLDSAAIGAAMASREFLTASVISFLLKLGDYLEEWTRRRFRKQLADMFKTGEDWVWVLRDGQEARIPLSDVHEGDTVIVRIGSLIPVDGMVVDGEAMVNQASLTGEGLAVTKREGRPVYAGTAVEEGMLHVRALKVGSETRAARVVKIIEEADSLKAETQSHGEKLADKVVPYSFLLSGLTYLFTRNPNRAAAVLLVDYSCAIKLSTPLAILAALAKAARHNVVIKGGIYLEKLSQADTIILDKTGTLTEATPQVVEIVAFNGFDQDYVLQQAACVEEHFPHPVATAVVRHAAERGLHHEEEHAEVEYLVAHGIVSRVHGNRIIVGSRHFIHEDEVVDISEADSHIETFAEKGYSVLYVAIADKLAGLIAIHDPLRQEARSFIDRLKAEKFEKIVMLTGDHEATARTVALSLGITDYYGQAFPEMKVKVIKALQKKGYTVVMVGDGINDSPALSHADVGISMKHGADIAKEASDILLMEGTLGDILYARSLSVDTLRRIKNNYRTIVGINSLAIILAMTGALPPVFSAALHNLSTIGVSLMSLAPLRKKSK
jgi:manganese/zinc-transporting P-type ATPase C